MYLGTIRILRKGWPKEGSDARDASDVALVSFIFFYYLLMIFFLEIDVVWGHHTTILVLEDKKRAWDASDASRALLGFFLLLYTLLTFFLQDFT